MADSNLIPPVSSNTPLPNRHQKSEDKREDRPASERRSPRRRHQQQDDDKPHIDEFA